MASSSPSQRRGKATGFLWSDIFLSTLYLPHNQVTDEQLQSFLVLRIKHPALENSDNSEHPPQVLLEVLAHVQVALEATYISAVPTVAEAPRTSRLLGTARNGSSARPSGRTNLPPSILPPSTPNPVPSTADQDRKYMASEGTMLVANIWGNNTAEDSSQGFALLWSEEQRAWLAIYCMAITVCASSSSLIFQSFNQSIVLQHI
jgi:hypothetical protein